MGNIQEINMLRIPHLLIVFVLLFSTACSQTNDFDALCSYFDSLENEADYDKLTALEKYTYLNTLVTNNLDSNSETRASWDAIVNLTASMRYQMFTEVAEASSGKSWQCESMQRNIKNLPD